jgi:hypothetical protein
MLCLFFPHRWRHIMNADDSLDPLESWSAGLYQCARCKEISIGSPRTTRPASTTDGKESRTQPTKETP